MPNVGDLIGARYRIEGEISQGGSATVYRAQDTRAGGPVALKHQRLSIRDNQDFLREARLLVDLHNRAPGDVRPHLVRVLDFGVDPQHGQFIVMEYLSGDDLATLMAGPSVPYIDDLLRWALDLLRLLEFLHNHSPPIIHYDIKPKNLKLRQSAIVLLDFGVAKPRTMPQQPVLVANNTLTPAYAALEVFEDRAPDLRSDLFALGATMYYLLSGHEPDTAQTRKALVDQGSADPLAPISDLNQHIHPQVSAVFLKAMQLLPEQRFASAGAMRAALHDAMRQSSAVPPTAKIPTGAGPAKVTEVLTPPPPAQPARRGGLMPVVLGLLALLVVAGLAAVALGLGRSSSSAEATSPALPPTAPPATLPATAEVVPPTAEVVPPTAEAVPPTAPAAPAELPAGAIVFASNRSGSFDIYAMDPDGANQRLIYGGPGDDRAPTLSPDRRRVAFVSRQAGGARDLYVIDIGGGAPTQLTNDAGDDDAPAWSPDGQQIVFAAQKDQDNDYEIMVVDVGDGALTQLTTNTSLDFAPAWSPDGQQIVFEGSRAGSIDLYLLAVGSDAEQRLTSAGRNQRPAWSPDGRQIVFQGRANENANFDLYRIGPAGGQAEQLTSGALDDTDPFWLPDGRIAFVSRDQGNDEIFLLDPDGGPPEPITRDPASDIDPG